MFVFVAPFVDMFRLNQLESKRILRRNKSKALAQQCQVVVLWYID